MKINTTDIKNALTEYMAASKKDRQSVALKTSTGDVVMVDVIDVQLDGDDATFALGDTDLGRYSAKAKRFYWKKFPAVLTFDGEANDADTGTEDEEGDEEERETPVICKDRTRYTPYVRGNRVSQDCADTVAMALRQVDDVEEVMSRGIDFLTEVEAELPKKSDAKGWVDHVAKWDKLNPGHRRMLIGQAIRTAEKRAEEEDELKAFHKALKAAFKSSK